MTRVSSIIGIKATDKSKVHKGKTFSTVDDVISEAAEHEDVYMGGTYLQYLSK